MDITPLIRPETKIIQSYGAGFFRVNGDVWKTSILVSGETVAEWFLQDNNALIITEQIKAIQKNIDVLLIGMGASFGVLPPSQRRQFAGLGFTVDVMDTPSACRTYNVLTAEGRRVAAALNTIAPKI